MKSKIEEIEATRWQRETSPFGRVLARSTARTITNDDSGRNALDLACGDGLLTKEICKHFKRVVAVDASKYHIDVARQRVPEAEFHIALIEDFNPAGELFDRIYMINILEHLDNPVETLSKIKQWLSENGSILIYVPNALSLNRRIGQKMGLLRNCYELGPQDDEVGHKRFYDIESLTKDITRSGLTPVATGSTLLKPFSNAQMEWFIEKWGEIDNELDWRTKLCDALYEIGNEQPQNANTIWIKCIIQRRNR